MGASKRPGVTGAKTQDVPFRSHDTHPERKGKE